MNRIRYYFTFILLNLATILQAQPIIDSVSFIPEFPTTEDEIKVVLHISFQKIWEHTFLGGSTVHGDTVEIFVTSWGENPQASPTRKDTVAVKRLQTGDYYLYVDVYGSPHQRADVLSPVANYLDSFSITKGGYSAMTNVLQSNKTTLYPNPARSIQTLNLYLDRSQYVEIDLYDASGKLVKTLTGAHFNAGKVSIPIDLSELQTGIYFCRISKESGNEVIKIIKQ